MSDSFIADAQTLTEFQSNSLAGLVQKGYYIGHASSYRFSGTTFRALTGHPTRREPKQLRTLDLSVRLWKYLYRFWFVSKGRTDPKLWLSQFRDCQDSRSHTRGFLYERVLHLEAHEVSLSQSKLSSFRGLGRTRNTSVRQMEGQLRELPSRHGTEAFALSHNRPQEQQWKLHSTKLSMGDSK